MPAPTKVAPQPEAPSLGSVQPRPRAYRSRALVITGAAVILVLGLAGAGGWYWLEMKPVRDFDAALAQNRLIVGKGSAYILYLDTQANCGAKSPHLQAMGAKALPLVESRILAVLDHWGRFGDMAPQVNWQEFLLLTDWAKRIDPTPMHRAWHDYAKGQVALYVDTTQGSAISNFQEALRETPDWTLAWKALGQAFVREGYQAAARECFERARQLDGSRALGSVPATR